SCRTGTDRAAFSSQCRCTLALLWSGYGRSLDRRGETPRRTHHPGRRPRVRPRPPADLGELGVRGGIRRGGGKSCPPRDRQRRNPFVPRGELLGVFPFIALLP